MPALHDQKIATLLNVPVAKVTATIGLLDEGNTLPFIARYRKEVTGGLDEEQIRVIEEQVQSLRALDERRETILASIEEQGKLTDELRAQIMAAETRTLLDDLYQPYKPKRKTRASVAREKGLEGLADLILQQVLTRQTLEQIAAPYLTEQVTSAEAAYEGARDIVAETVSDNPDVRQAVRERAMKWGLLQSALVEGAEDARRVYEMYYDYQCRVDLLRPHQVLAMNRGEAEKVLRLRVDIAERDWLMTMEQRFRANPRSPLAEQLQAAIRDGAERLLLPAIERGVRAVLTEKAEEHAISVFASNLRALLSQPPLAGHTVMGIDPGYRTGCKVVVVDPTGKLLEETTIYPHEPKSQWTVSLDILARLVERHGVTLISSGNGTASRETEKLIADLIKRQPGVHYVITNEAGASVYSASPLARAELPDLDVSVRGAVSIARRVQDPLAELVKIEPKAIGVGMYQHDVDQGELTRTLHGVVESVVNQVGVDVNTASPALLTYVAGIGPKLAENIVSFRNQNGRFSSREFLKKVSGLGQKAFEQSAGFLRVRGGPQPLDSSAIHPESYTVALQVLELAGVGIDAPAAEKKAALDALVKAETLPVLAKALGTGVPTLTDILEQLVRPGRDPREDLPAPILRSDVLSMEDLLPGMELNGTVRNVVDFGAFVDIGVKQDGLLHRTQIPSGTLLKVGDIIKVSIVKVEAERGRISLAWVDR